MQMFLKMARVRFQLVILGCVVGIYSISAHSQTIDANAYYRLTTQWQGEGKSLDVVNEGRNNKLQLADTGNYSGQFWKFTPINDGYYRLTTQWQGEGKSLDVINDGTNNKLQLADTGNYSGQFWKLTPASGGYYRLTTQWQGEGKSLDVINDGTNNKLQLADTGNYSGQFWKLTKVSSAQPAAKKRAVEAGPIWNQADAEEKCPRVASQNNATWTGEWWTTIQGKMSVCEIR
ncbi:MAG: RICIN domain-containing protein [Chromatiaceae bacterium]|nr:RICIN domain-containing protein [Chromatiaceae bacterium]MCF8002697.1 RICIN domain-containing protein [Chromatiaceae bacterium]